MNIDNSVNNGNKYFLDFLDNIEETESLFISLNEKNNFKDDLKYEKVIDGFNTLWFFTYAFTQENLRRYPDELLLRIRKAFVENFRDVVEEINSNSENFHDSFLFILKEPLKIVNSVLDTLLTFQKILIQELPNSYINVEDFELLTKHKKDIINTEYKIKEHYNLDSINLFELIKSHITEQQNILMFRSTQKLKKDIVINEIPSNSPFITEDTYLAFDYIDKGFKDKGKAKYTYIFDFIKDELENTLSESLYFNFIIETKNIKMTPRAQPTATSEIKRNLVRELYLNYSNNIKK